jgi:tetratricopeptide (TPR) repeat protein
LEEFFENELADKFEQMLENNEEFYFDTEELEEVIIHYLEIGDIEFAERAVDFAIKLHPNSPEIKTKKLEVLLELENHTEAKKIIDELKESSMKDTDFLVCCAKYYSDLGNSKRAIEYCENALALEEEESFLHNFIGDELMNMENYSDALKHYKLAIQFDPDDDYALENVMFCYKKLNVNDEAIDFLNDYLDQFSFSETAWFEYGQYFFNKKNYKEALKGFDYLLAINPESVNVYGNKAKCLEAMEQWEKAISVYEEMLELEFTKAHTYYKIGLCYRKMQQPISALNAFQESLREDPQFYLSMAEQSYLYEEMGEIDKALYFAEEAAFLNEDNLDYQRRVAFLCINAEKYEESLSFLEKLIDAEPHHFHHWYIYVEVLMILDEYEVAVAVLNIALENSRFAEFYYQLSHCHFTLGQNSKGRIALANAIKMNPKIANEMQSRYPSIAKEVRRVAKEMKK